MFVELAKACVAEKKYSVLEKTEHSLIWKKYHKMLQYVMSIIYEYIYVTCELLSIHLCQSFTDPDTW